MRNISLRAAADDDAAFTLHVTQACMRVYAEQTYGSWDGRADLNVASDKIIQHAGRVIGLMGVDRSCSSKNLKRDDDSKKVIAL